MYKENYGSAPVLFFFFFFFGLERKINVKCPLPISEEIIRTHANMGKGSGMIYCFRKSCLVSYIQNTEGKLKMEDQLRVSEIIWTIDKY